MFSNSPTIGDWETIIAQDLTTFIDKRYRTIASRDGRGLAGHSMGGYGTKRFVGDDCGLCKDTQWSLERKQFADARGSK